MNLNSIVRTAIALLAAAMLIATNAAIAQQNGGATKVGGGDGFGCASGTGYQMIGGVARCASTAAASTTTSCPAAVLMDGACSFNFPATTSGSAPSIATSTPGYGGVAQATCSGGTWGGLTGSCTPNPCVAAATSFGACSFSIPPLTSGNSATVPTLTPGYTGSDTAGCTNGSLAFSAQSCNPVPPPPAPCPAGTFGWGSACSGPVSTTASGSLAVVTNTAASYTGSATFSCTGGTWGGPTGASCNPIPSCPAVAPSNSQALSCAPGYSGSLTETRTVTCNASTGWTWQAGPWSAPVGSCIPTTTPSTGIIPELAMPNGWGVDVPGLGTKGTITLSISASGTWWVAISGKGARLINKPSGTWTTDTTVGYEYMVSAPSATMGTAVMPLKTSGWATMPGGTGAMVAKVSLTGGGVPEAESTWTISVRKAGASSPVTTHTFTLDANNSD